MYVLRTVFTPAKKKKKNWGLDVGLTQARHTHSTHPAPTQSLPMQRSSLGPEDQRTRLLELGMPPLLRAQSSVLVAIPREDRLLGEGRNPNHRTWCDSRLSPGQWCEHLSSGNTSIQSQKHGGYETGQHVAAANQPAGIVVCQVCPLTLRWHLSLESAIAKQETCSRNSQPAWTDGDNLAGSRCRLMDKVASKSSISRKLLENGNAIQVSSQAACFKSSSEYGLITATPKPAYPPAAAHRPLRLTLGPSLLW